MIRLIATDLDGTLLASDGCIPDASVAALCEAHARGVRLLVATGRPSRWLGCLAPIAHLDPIVVASNGAVAYDLRAERVLTSHTFGPGVISRLTDTIRAKHPAVMFGLERGDLFGIEPGTPSDHAFDPGVLRLPLTELIALVTPVVKLLAYSTEHDSDGLTGLVADAVGGAATVTTSVSHDDFGMSELSVPGVTKASAIAEVCRALEVAASDVVAFGDMPNDREMLEWAGRGFTMEGGHPSLRVRFPSAGRADDGGVGVMVRRLLDET